MKVSPVDEKAKSEEKMKNGWKIDQYLAFGIYIFMYSIGLNPYKINKETGEISFKWLSYETFWSLVRLVLFNSPFSFLPVVLFLVFGMDEWDGMVNKLTNSTSNATMNATLNTTSTTAYGSDQVYKMLVAIEYISSYSFFILQKRCKSKLIDYES